MANGWCRPPTRWAIYIRDGFKCTYCGYYRFLDLGLSLDHIVPTSKGGGNTPTNLVTSCMNCNRKKSDKSSRQWYAWLRKMRGTDTTRLKHKIYRRRRKAINRRLGGKVYRLKKNMLKNLNNMLGAESCKFKIQ